MIALRLLISAGILAVPVVAAAQQGADSVRGTRAGVYTAAQATEGRTTFQFSCANCHTLEAHVGPAFAAKWDGRPLWELYRFISQAMPKSEPGSLSANEYAGVVAYLLKLNGMPSGVTALLPDSSALKQIRLELAPKRDSTP